MRPLRRQDASGVDAKVEGQHREYAADDRLGDLFYLLGAVRLFRLKPEAPDEGDRGRGFPLVNPAMTAVPPATAPIATLTPIVRGRA